MCQTVGTWPHSAAKHPLQCLPIPNRIEEKTGRTKMRKLLGQQRRFKGEGKGKTTSNAEEITHHLPQSDWCPDSLSKTVTLEVNTPCSPHTVASFSTSIYCRMMLMVEKNPLANLFHLFRWVPSNLLCIPSPLFGEIWAGKRESFDTMQALFSKSSNMAGCIISAIKPQIQNTVPYELLWRNKTPCQADQIHRYIAHLLDTVPSQKSVLRNLKNMHSELFVFVLARNIHPNFLEGNGHASPSQIHILLKLGVHDFEKPVKEVVSKYLPRLGKPACHKICIYTKTQRKKTHENQENNKS